MVFWVNALVSASFTNPNEERLRGLTRGRDVLQDLTLEGEELAIVLGTVVIRLDDTSGVDTIRHTINDLLPATIGLAWKDERNHLPRLGHTALPGSRVVGSGNETGTRRRRDSGNPKFLHPTLFADEACGAVPWIATRFSAGSCHETLLKQELFSKARTTVGYSLSIPLDRNVCWGTCTRLSFAYGLVENCIPISREAQVAR